MKFRLLPTIATLLLGAVSIPLNAAVIVTNPSFEDDVFGDGGSGGVSSGWTTGNGGGYNPQDTQFTGTTGLPGMIPGTGDGMQVAYQNGTSPLYQDVGTIEASSVYELTVAIGQRLDLGWSDLTIELRAGSASGLVLAGEVFDASDAPDGTFSDVSISFDSSDFAGEVGNNLFITFRSTGVQALYDNVRLTESPVLVPEPSTALLGAFGSLLLLRRRR